MTKRQMYSQVNSIINELGDEFISKLPEDVYNTILENRDVNYNPKINLAKSLGKQKVTKEALSMIAYLHVKYWSTQEEKEKIKEILISKNIEVKKDENVENIMEAITPKQENDINENALVVQQDKNNFIEKIIDKILIKYFKL